ncbi:MAG TPA: HlyD family efflux transporter periplasmic adaptor subunit [Usitatibacteraceae bacterium]|nr:HlyD family efflux transporter periplasmic adaptor subunit [Usitatibacteraceae bacterium]
MTKKLFRQEAIDAQREKFLGEATIARPLPLWMMTLLAAGIAVLVVAIAVWGQYTRRERVEGVLQLDIGAAKVSFSDAGRIAELMVKEGQTVKEGDPMVRLAIERSSTGSAATGALVASELAQRRESLEKEQLRLRELADQQLQQVKKRASALDGEIRQLDAEIKLQGQRVNSAKEQAQRFKQLAGEKFVSDIVARQKQDEATDQELKLQSLRRQKTSLERELANTRLDEPAVELKARNESEKVSRQISELAQTVAQEDAKRETVIRAPITGTVTNITVSAGQSVMADAAFATILPAGSVLQAEMLVPTRAIGFVTKGKEVTLRYDAFPYERFGQYRAVISEVSQTVWSAGDKVGPLVVKEPAYKIVATLDRQKIGAAGDEVALRPGMLFNADILLDKRSLLEWIFEPVLQLKGRL